MGDPLYCQICEIPFDVPRIRRHDEPPEAAWGMSGQDFIYWDELQPCENCSATERIIPGERGVAFEHIAGLNCQSFRGYSGHRITAVEMRDINSIQCLSVKYPDWRPEDGDDDFEFESILCFVAGIGAEGLDGSVDLEPQRHGIGNFTLVTNDSCGELDISDQFSLPLHPRCLEMFKKQSLRRLGRVDIDAVWQWRDKSGPFPTGRQPWHTDLSIVLGDSYHCQPGTEFLVANPIHIPGLNRVISDCVLSQDGQGDPVFPVRTSTEVTDHFAKLPTELRFMIIEQLSRKDIAHVRLVSRSFSQLPQSYFHHLVTSEMPWVWEIDSLYPKRVDWHRLWCKLSRADGGPEVDSEMRIWNERPPYKGHENLERTVARFEASYAAVGLFAPREDEVLKGLRNRRRIYPIIEHILTAVHGV